MKALRFGAGNPFNPRVTITSYCNYITSSKLFVLLEKITSVKVETNPLGLMKPS